MAFRKTRSKTKKSKPIFHLDWGRWEEIAAIGVLILAALTALGAFDLSGGVLLTSWVQLLQMLLGWGVYFTPLILAGLGVWLLFDSMDRIVNIGWERPIGLALGYLWIVSVLHWISAFNSPTRMPGPFQGGGLLGWAIVSALVQGVGVVGTGVALLAVIGIAVILLFNISLPELVHRIMGIRALIPSRPRRISAPAKWVPDEFEQPALPMPPPMPQPVEPPVTPERERASAPISRKPVELPEEEDPAKVEPKNPVAARIIGGSTAEPAPAGNANAVAPVPVILREWNLPSVADILEESPEQEISQQEIRSKVRIIEETLSHFGVPAKVLEVNQGPTITQFGVEPGFIEQRGGDSKIHRVKVKVSRISALQHDLELALAAAPIRIEAPVPGRSVVGIEVPNSQVGMVSLRGIIESDAFKGIKSKLKVALGQDVAGQPICGDLTTMPHLLIAGATGSGKSVCINAIIAGLLCTTTPGEVQFVMVDPKRVELINYNSIPHLMRPVVVEVEGAVAALASAVEEMDRRFKLFATKGARNIETYNRLVEDKLVEKLPFLIVIVDELADLMMEAASEVEPAIIRLAQMARATGIHLILATQRPSVDVVTGLIKANFPARISFAVTSQIDSRVVLDSPGAEKLLGRGDMLYMSSTSPQLQRLQGCYVSDRELEKLTTYWKQFAPSPTPGQDESDAVSGPVAQAAYWGDPKPAQPGANPGEDNLLPQAIEIIQQSKKASVSLLQRKLRIGYSRAARLIELLEEKGMIGPDEGPTKGRAVMMPSPAAPPPPQPKKAKPASRDFEEDNYDDWTDEDWEDLDKE